VFVINSFSKYFNMTGWRLGWMVVPAGYVGEFEKLSQSIYLSAPTPSQHARWRRSRRKRSQSSKRAARSSWRGAISWCRRWREIGFSHPGGAAGGFYIYADCSALCADSFVFVRDLLEKAGVAVTPGADFGANAAERHVRFAYTSAVPVLAEGVRRIAEFVRRGNAAQAAFSTMCCVATIAGELPAPQLRVPC